MRLCIHNHVGLLLGVVLLATADATSAWHGAVPDEIASAYESIVAETANLRAFNGFLGSIDTATTDDVFDSCNASATAYLQARKAAGCEAASDNYDCSTNPVEACCEDGAWVEASDTHCDEGCCLGCTSDSTTYDVSGQFDCNATEADAPRQYVGVSVCGTETNTEGYAPMHPGYDCSTSPAHTIKGDNSDNVDDESDDPITDLPDCTQLDKDFMAGTSGESISAIVFGENASHPYKQMTDAVTLNFHATVMGGALFVKFDAKCVLALSPRLNGYLATTTGANESASTLDFRIYNPTVDAAQDMPALQGLLEEGYIASNISGLFVAEGNLTVVAGISHGSIEVYTSGTVKMQGLFSDGEVTFGMNSSSVHLADLTNHGSVSFDGTKNVAMQNITNTGSVVVSGLPTTVSGGCAAIDDLAFNFVLVDIENSGDVSFTGGAAALYSVESTTTGEVYISSGCFLLADIANDGRIVYEAGDAFLRNVTNAGIVTMNDGSAVVSGLVNTGNVTIHAGLVDITLLDNSGGSLVVADGVTGTIRLLSGGGQGTVTIPTSGVTLVGFDDDDDGGGLDDDHDDDDDDDDDGLDDNYMDDNYMDDDDDRSAGTRVAVGTVWTALVVLLTTEHQHLLLWLL